MADKRGDSCAATQRDSPVKIIFFFAVCENNLHKLLSRMWAKNTEAICRIVCPIRSGFEPNSGQNE